MAAEVGWSQARYWRFENHPDPLLTEITQVASILRLELSAGLHRTGVAIADRGQQALLRRFRSMLSSQIRVMAEVPLPTPGDRRSWDLLLRIDAQLVGVEAETRIRDIQATVRRVRWRERDGGVDEILLVIARTRANRAVVEQLLEALGRRFTTSGRAIRHALAIGTPLPGSGILLI